MSNKQSYQKLALVEKNNESYHSPKSSIISEANSQVRLMNFQMDNIAKLNQDKSGEKENLIESRSQLQLAHGLKKENEELDGIKIKGSSSRRQEEEDKSQGCELDSYFSQHKEIIENKIQWGTFKNEIAEEKERVNQNETEKEEHKIVNANIATENSPEENMQKTTKISDEEEEDDIKRVIEMREFQKIKLSKRRQSIRKKRISENNVERRKSQVLNRTGDITAIIKKSEDMTSYGKNKKWMKIIDIMIAITVCVNIAISIVDNEIYISYSDIYLNDLSNKTDTQTEDVTVSKEKLSKIENRVITKEENFLRFMNIFIVITNEIFICIHYKIKINLLKADHKLSRYDNIFSSGLYKYLFTELIVCAVFYPPFLNVVISGDMLGLIYVYNVNSIVSVIVMLKCYIILRVYTYFSRWTSDAALTICNKYNVRAGVHFAIKAELKKRPYTMLTILVGISLSLCAFAIRTFEYGVKDPSISKTSSLKGENDLQSLINCFWLIIITMTTVGYGDIYPKSHLGRFVGVAACIIGMLLVSLIVVSLAVIAEFTNEEKKAYSILKKLQADNNAFDKAANVISHIMKLRLLFEKRKIDMKISVKRGIQDKAINSLAKRFIIFTQLKRDISVFKNDFKIATSYSLPLDEMLKRLEGKLKDDIGNLTKTINKMSTVDEKLDSISFTQDYVKKKMRMILSRQGLVADYIIQLNNLNYIDRLNMRRAQKRKGRYELTAKEASMHMIANNHHKSRYQVDSDLVKNFQYGKSKDILFENQE